MGPFSQSIGCPVLPEWGWVRGLSPGHIGTVTDRDESGWIRFKNCHDVYYIFRINKGVQSPKVIYALGEYMPFNDPRYTPPLLGAASCKQARALSMTDAGDKSNPPLEHCSECTILVGNDGEYLEVSDGFCRLVGYSRDQLLRMKLQDLAAPGTADITSTFNPLTATGCAHGLWLLVSSEGTRVLVKHESRARIDSLIESQLELIGAGY